ncbi:Rsm22-domain-containing protein [Neurospora tetraspora]|uniref:Rsm22-domain-containing protein n=1 Tax=Neurospora tetraspora TaxID=94610 RepID=A0AAE0JPW5_9PEZI|nr:Rsm22-domain-containing protein [Neurospora tetraspora]
MLSAGRLQNRCPGCRQQVLSFYDALLQQRTRVATRPLLRPSPTSPAARRGLVRHISSTRSVFQEATQSTAGATSTEPPAEDPELSREDADYDAETFVRQARQTFKHTLPYGYFTEEEYKIYERLYGAPLRETVPDDVGIPQLGGVNVGGQNGPQRTLFMETESGHFEEVEYTIEQPPVEESDVEAVAELRPLTEAQIDYLNVTANNKREFAALMRLQRDFEAASLRPLEEIVEEEEVQQEEEVEHFEEEEGVEEEEEGWLLPEKSVNDRIHPHTAIGIFKTKPSTLLLPKKTFTEPIKDLLSRTNPTHVREHAEQVFGGPGLPHSPATPATKKNLGQKPVAMQAGHHRMSAIEADTYITTVLPGLYATSTSILVEVRKRLGSEWLQGLLTNGTGPRVLDVGAGGAGLAAWQEVLQAEWELLREQGKVQGREPLGKKTVVVGSENLRQRVSQFLHNTTFLPRLPDYLHSAEGAERMLDSDGGPGQRKVFDVIIASHQLMPLDKTYKRKDFIDNLWTMLNPEGGVLIVLEKGHPRGFEAVADVRDRMLNEFIIPPVPVETGEDMTAVPESGRIREPGHIIAPCTNHTKCPMYLTPGHSAGRKDFCHFSQRFVRPSFLQRVLGASHRNHEDIEFSYIAIRRGAHPDGVKSSSSGSNVTDPASSFFQGPEAVDRAFKGYEDVEAGTPHALSLPRNVMPPLKSKGHVTLDLCTPAGTIERWVVPKSFSKQAYHDARKAKWGDLWALGAKTRTRREIRLGKAGKNAENLAKSLKNPDDGGVRSRELAGLGSKKKPRVVEVTVDPNTNRILAASEKYPNGRAPVERRTKNGKKVKMNDLMDELQDDPRHGKYVDPDDIEDEEFRRAPLPEGFLEKGLFGDKK